MLVVAVACVVLNLDEGDCVFSLVMMDMDNNNRLDSAGLSDGHQQSKAVLAFFIYKSKVPSCHLGAG